MSAEEAHIDHAVADIDANDNDVGDEVREFGSGTAQPLSTRSILITHLFPDFALNSLGDRGYEAAREGDGG